MQEGDANQIGRELVERIGIWRQGVGPLHPDEAGMPSREPSFAVLSRGTHDLRLTLCTFEQ
jgi:hypothetical protein